MNEHQRQTAFLRHLIALDNTDERRKLDEGIAQVQRDGRCVKRAAALMALLTALGVVGLGYGVVLQENFPYGKSGFFFNLLCALGLAAMICLLFFGALLMVYRRKLNGLREDCRRLVLTVVESRLGKSSIPLALVVAPQGGDTIVAPHEPHRDIPAPRGDSLWAELVDGKSKTPPQAL